MEAVTKICSKCQEEKSLESFNKQTTGKYGVESCCKKCKSVYKKEYYKNNPEKAKIFLINNPDYFNKYYTNNKSHIDKQHKEYCNSNEKIRDYKKNYIREYIKTYSKIPKQNISNRISKGIIRSLKNGKNGYHWENLVGYTIQNLMLHLEKQFIDGMSWDNQGKWHIHHKLCVSWWQFDTPQDREFKQCWALCNLQPLWAEENLSKGNKIDYKGNLCYKGI